MTDDPFRGEQPPGDLPRYPPPDPWAVPGFAGWSDAPDPGAFAPRKRSRRVRWIAALTIVVLALGVGGGAYAYAHRTSSTAAAPPVVSARPSTPAPQASPPKASTPQASPTQPSPTPAPSSGIPLLPAGASPDPGTGPLDHYLLAPSEVGAGSLMFLNDGGRSITDQATLDWCNFTYTSETLRTSRVQVQYTSAGAIPAGNEFVRYQTGGTTKAWAELQQAVSGCPPVSQADGFIYSQVVRAPHEANLVSHQLVLSYQVVDSSGQLALPWQAVVYQFDGNYFSGVYVYGHSRALALTEALRLGAVSARHLAEAAAGKLGTGGGKFQAFPSPSSNGVQV